MQKISQALQILKNNLLLFSLINLTIWLPAYLFIEWFTLNQPTDEYGLQVFQMTMRIEGFFGPIVSGATIYALSKIKQQETVTYGEAIQIGFKKWGKVFLVRLISGIWIFLGFLALIIPGIMLSLRYSLVACVAVLEDWNSSDVLKRSAQLTENRRGKIFLTMLLAWLVVIIASFLIGFISAIFGLDRNFWALIIMDCLISIVSIIVDITLFLFYWDAKRKEDSMELAEN